MSKNTHNTKTSDIERSDERINETGEVFTPMELCHQMVSEIPESTLRDTTSTFLDPSAGSGELPTGPTDETTGISRLITYQR